MSSAAVAYQVERLMQWASPRSGAIDFNPVCSRVPLTASSETSEVRSSLEE